MKDPLGVHLLVEGDCSPSLVLDDVAGVKATVLAAIEACGGHLLELSVHHFSPQGVTVVATLAESHLAVHTWPERGAFAADLFHCAPFDTEAVVGKLVHGLKAEHWESKTIQRGG